MHLAIALLFAVSLAYGQVNALEAAAHETMQRDLRLWKASVVALGAASAADVASSWGKCCERNRLLSSPDQRFGARGLAIKSAGIGGQMVLQYLLVRKNPRLARVLSFVNFAGAGTVTAVAIRNYRIPRQP